MFRRERFLLTLVSTLLAGLVCVGQSSAAGSCQPLQISFVSGTSLVPQYESICGLSLNLPAGGNYRVTGLDLGIISGTSRMNGIQANLLLNITPFSDSFEGGMRGIQIAGLTNILFGTQMTGIQIAGLVNAGSGTGLQLASLVNVGGGTQVQVALFNVSSKGTSGVQLGAVNLADAMTGAQCCGIYNSAEALSGIQIGLVNRTTNPYAGFSEPVRSMIGARNEPSTGLQLGMINLADAVTGVQCGLVNRAVAARGLQIGLFNIATDLYGVQIGALNIIEHSSVPFMPIVNMRF